MADLPVITIATQRFPNFLALPAKTVIGDLVVETAVAQEHTDRTTITRKPVQQGAAITDHSYLEPSTVVLRCGWSNASLAAAKAIVAGFFAGGSMSSGSYVHGIYSQLLALRDTRQPFDVNTIRRKYPNMMIANLHVTTDQETAQALMVEASLEQVIIVSTSTSTLPPQENQATPESTAEVANGGTKTLESAAPSPGGSLSPTQWISIAVGAQGLIQGLIR